MAKPGKRIFITGGASGLGRALAMHFAKKNYRVAIGDINQANLDACQKELLSHTKDVLCFHCDTTRIEELELIKQALVAQWDGVDVVINNAGVGGTAGPIETIPMADWQAVIDVNLMGVIHGCRVFTPLLKKQGGAIVNIASSAALFTPPFMSSYTVTKAAVVGLSETLRAELSPSKIHVHVVCPGFFKTNLTDSIKGTSPGINDFVERAMAKSPIDAKDIARMIDRQIQNNDFLLVPHRLERNLWRLKKYFPWLFARKMQALARRIHKKTSKS